MMLLSVIEGMLRKGGDSISQCRSSDDRFSTGNDTWANENVNVVLPTLPYPRRGKYKRAVPLL